MSLHATDSWLWSGVIIIMCMGVSGHGGTMGWWIMIDVARVLPSTLTFLLILRIIEQPITTTIVIWCWCCGVLVSDTSSSEVIIGDKWWRHHSCCGLGKSDVQGQKSVIAVLIRKFAFVPMLCYNYKNNDHNYWSGGRCWMKFWGVGGGAIIINTIAF